MKYIKKYVRFFENETMVATPTKKALKQKGEYATVVDVVNRLDEIYKSLSSDKKNEIDSYFK
jgi:hypothetical protein